MKTKELFIEIQNLHLPEGEYVVLGSGILCALGIRDSKDVDLLVNRQTFDHLRETGWGDYSIVDLDGRKREKLVRGMSETFADMWVGDREYRLEELLKDAQYIREVPFVNLKILREMKNGWGRPKDYLDIDLIDTYLKRMQ